MCQIINGSKETLGKALNNLKVEIHPALKSAYSSIYGYTSDENGTRHANGIGEKNATFEEAKYMLVSCSAFVNYLKENFEGKNGEWNESNGYSTSCLLYTSDAADEL